MVNYIPRKNNRPSTDEYFGLEAEAYGSSKWMARNQIQTTQKVLELLESEQIGGIIINSRGLSCRSYFLPELTQMFTLYNIELSSIKTSPSVRIRIFPLALETARFNAADFPFPWSFKSFKAADLFP